MTAAHVYQFEVPPNSGAPAQAVDEAAEGEVVYLTRGGETVAALVPPDVAAAGSAAVIALEDAADLRSARAAIREGGEPIPAEDLWAELGL